MDDLAVEQPGLHPSQERDDDEGVLDSLPDNHSITVNETIKCNSGISVHIKSQDLKLSALSSSLISVPSILTQNMNDMLIRLPRKRGRPPHNPIANMITANTLSANLISTSISPNLYSANTLAGMTLSRNIDVKPARKRGRPPRQRTPDGQPMDKLSDKIFKLSPMDLTKTSTSTTKTTTPTIIKIPDEHSNGLKYMCVECGVKVRQSSSLRRHLKVFHSSETLLSCPNCLYKTPRRDNLKEHMLSHEVKTEEKGNDFDHHPGQRLREQRHPEEFECSLCGYKCTVSKAWEQHLMQHKKGTLVGIPRSCRVCGRDFMTEESLQEHAQQHRDGKYIICDICGYTNTQMKKVIEHRRTHTGEKPHKCPFCDYRSARRDNTINHAIISHEVLHLSVDTFCPVLNHGQSSAA